MPRRLAVVTPDDASAATPTPSLADAVASGDHLQILLAQRRDIVASLPDEKGPAKAALHRQLMLISRDIQALEQARSLNSDGSVVSSADDEAWDGTGY